MVSGVQSRLVGCVGQRRVEWRVCRELSGAGVMVLHTGRDLDQLVADDFFELRASSVQKSGLGSVALSPVRKGDTAGLAKAKKQVTAKMHQRVRDRLPHLPTLVDTAERHRADQAAFRRPSSTAGSARSKDWRPA
jgi:hypothetical protein